MLPAILLFSRRLRGGSRARHNGRRHPALGLAFGGHGTAALAQAATVYASCGKSGTAVTLSAGLHQLRDLTQLGMSNDTISAVSVQSGFRVTL